MQSAEDVPFITNNRPYEHNLNTGFQYSETISVFEWMDDEGNKYRAVRKETSLLAEQYEVGHFD